jgi:hypothetical protein
MKTVTLLSLCTFAACGTDARLGAGPDAGPVDDGITHRSDVTLVTRAQDAKPGVFIPPFEDCRDPLPGEPAGKKNGKVCTNVSIAGATEANRSFAAYAACDIVLTQRPYYATPPAKVPPQSDPRLADSAMLAELEWAKSEINASGCVCCHDSRTRPPGQWDINAGPLWMDTLSDSGLSLFGGFADSSVLGAYPAADNHGFDRIQTGIPTIDTARMKKLVNAEMARRGISEANARAVPPFGGPIYTNSVAPPTQCGAGEGVDRDGRILFNGGSARYVYVLEPGSANPGVPPNFDRPKGTVWRLDVLPSADAIPSGMLYAKTPAGSYQDTPEKGAAPALENGKTYQLYVLKDVGVPRVNCLFKFGTPVAPAVDAGTPQTDAGTDAGPGGFGAVCMDSTQCNAPSDYCALAPGATTGYCTQRGCKEMPSICPAGWKCFDLSVFQAGAPSICQKP